MTARDIRLQGLLALGVCAILLVSKRTAAGAAATRGRAIASDTMPEQVIQRGEEAFNRHDARALGALYAPDAVLTILCADACGKTIPAGSDSVETGMRRYWQSQKKLPTIRHLDRIVAGRFVAEKDEMTTDRGTSGFIDLYEVRGGLIVHEWQEPQ